jgi:regulator of sirC expression with transglutaminase-like and TPR domain
MNLMLMNGNKKVILSWLMLMMAGHLFTFTLCSEEKVSGLDSSSGVSQWVKKSRSSVVNIKSYDQHGQLVQSGTGFMLSSDGKIATHLSSIKESSQLMIEFEDGREDEVISIHASDDVVDLAILKIEGKGYHPLITGGVEFIEEGDVAILLGYSFGIEDNIFKGQFLDRDELQGLEVFRIDLMADRSYTGGPVFNQDGEVVGVLGQKAEDESSYVVQANHLQTMLDNPNPISMETWLKYGRLDVKYWKPKFGAQWLEKKGEIHVRDPGEGFGGRALCLWQQPKPKGDIELSVSVKLEDESGAAGLVFHADGSEKHYAFYPSNGKMRLTYFGGPNVYSWEIIEEINSLDYNKGQWNQLKVTLEDGRISCYVNEKLVIQSNHNKRIKGRVGLAKFRDTVASFKNFNVTKYAFKEVTQREKIDEINDMVERLPAFPEILQEDIHAFSKQEELARLVLIEKQNRLKKELEDTRKLMDEIHLRNVAREMNKVLAEDEQSIDLWKLSLLVAKLDDRSLDISYYLKRLNKMAAELKRGTKGFTQLQLKEKLDQFLFKENGYHGARFDYYQKQNSYVHRVLEDRKGIPITLSILYMELGKRLGLKLEGVGLPGHFIVKMNQDESEPLFIDVFYGGKTLEWSDMEELVSEHTKEGLKEEYLKSMSKKQIAKRMLSNLLVIAESDSDKESMLRYLATEVSILPELINERVMLSVMYYEAGRQMAAEEQLRYLLNKNIRLEDVRKIEDMLVYMMNHPKS